jgi:hypothetical protein
MSRVVLRALPALLAAAVACGDQPAPISAAPAPDPLFAQTPSNPTPTFKFPLDPSLALRSDGRFVSGGFSVYTHGVCGVNTNIFIFGSESGDATLQTNNPRFSDRKCPYYPRTVTVDYDDGVVETIPVFMNVRALHQAGSEVPVGESAERVFAVNPPQTTRCDRLIWGDAFGGRNVLVTRTASGTWEVASQPPHSAWCSTTGTVHQNMVVRFTIVL